LHESESDGASYLTAAQYHDDPYGIDPRVQNDGADKSFLTLRVDGSYSVSDNLRLLAFAYGTEQGFSRWFSRPTGGGVWKQREESYDREVRGVGVNLNGRNTYNGVGLNWVSGVEAFREATDFIYYDGQNNRQPTAAPITNRESSLDSESLFAEIQADVHRLFMPSIGVRYDRFSGGCKLNGVETGNDPCGSLNDMNNVSPKFGIRSAISDQVMLRASWSEGFALPNGFVKYTQSARNLDPVIFRQTEIGANFQVSNNWQATRDLRLEWVYGIADSEIRSNANAAIEGNEVGGVAEYNSNLSLNWSITPALSLDTSWRKVGGYALNSSNTDYADSYG